MYSMDFNLNGNTPGCRLFAGEKNLTSEELVQAKEEILAAKKLIQLMKLRTEEEQLMLERLDDLYVEAEQLYRSKVN